MAACPLPRSRAIVATSSPAYRTSNRSGYTCTSTASPISREATGVDIGADPNHREAIDDHPEHAEILQAGGRQRAHLREFLLQLRLPAAIPTGEDRPQELLVVGVALEVVALAPA
jgi:hypothetical protein